MTYLIKKIFEEKIRKEDLKKFLVCYEQIQKDIILCKNSNKT